MPFTPHGLEWLTTFCTAFDAPARLSRPDDPAAPRVGKVTHPSCAPDNHLLTVWSPGPVNSNAGPKKPAIDGGIYLIKDGQPIDEPGRMLLVRNDPNYNEQWPRALPVRVAPLTDENRRTLVRWIDLGCPIDLAFDPACPTSRGNGWLADDNRPTLALSVPTPGANGPLTEIVVGMHD